MFRVLFSNVSDDCTDDEVYDYIRSHSARSGSDSISQTSGRGPTEASVWDDPVVNALRLRGCTDISSTETTSSTRESGAFCSATTTGVVFVDYASRAAAEESLRHSISIHGTLLTKALLGGSVARDELADDARRATRQAPINNISSDVAVAKRHREAAVAEYVYASTDMTLRLVFHTHFPGRSSVSSGSASGHAMWSYNAVEVFHTIDNFFAFHGGKLHRADRVGLSNEVQIRVGPAAILLASLFKKSVAAEPLDQKQAEVAEPSVVSADLLDPELSSYAMKHHHQVHPCHVTITTKLRTAQLPQQIWARSYTPLLVAKRPDEVQKANGAAATDERVKALVSRLLFSASAPSSQGEPVAYRDAFGNILFVNNERAGANKL